MTHRAEQIVAAVHTAVTGLITTGANAFRATSRTIDPGGVSALVVWQGPDLVQSEVSGDQLTCALAINIDVDAADAGADTVLNQIRAEVTTALASSHTLGLAFVSDIREVGSDDLQVIGAGLRMRMRWLATYRRSRTDPLN